MNTLATTNRCGCPSVDPGAVARWATGSKASCGCGGSCGGGSCGCGGATSSDTTTSGLSCTSGTAEATARPGVVTAGCLPPRPRFFPGQLVTDADLTAAVDYQRSKQLLSNALLSGWGIYAGFPLCIDEATCSVCVGPGVAVDAKGRELVHASSICIQRPAAQDVEAQNCDPCAEQPDEELYLAIVYDDCLDGAKPRYGSVCGASADPGCDFSRVRERARLVWLRNVDDGYWTSGCLADPCGQATGTPTGCEPQFDDRFRILTKLRLDACTPCIGIRGGAGVQEYAAALDRRWSLSRNVQLLTDEQAKKNGASSLGVATLIDVISGVAWEPCPGEAVVVLGRVGWASTANGPAIKVTPVRRRVLSNAHLTYLVEWLLEYVIAEKRATNGQAEDATSPPPDTGLCENPCVANEKLVADIADAALGKRAVTKEVELKTRARVAYAVVVERKKTYEDFDQDTFLEILATAQPRAKAADRAAALRRFHDLVGRVASQAAIERGVTMLFPEGVPAEKQTEVENEVYDFLRKRDFGELGTAPFDAVLGLATKIEQQTLGRGNYPKAETERLSKLFPDAQSAGEARELEALREHMKKLEEELLRVKGQPPEAPSAGGVKEEKAKAAAADEPAKEEPGSSAESEAPKPRRK